MNAKTLHKISYGLYIVTSKIEDKINGQIANTVMQITSEPKTIALGINKKNLTHEYISESKVFAVSILSKEAEMKLIGNFGFKCGRDIDKCRGIDYKIGLTGSPLILEGTVGYIEAEVIDIFDCETHTIFVGKVIDAEILNDKEPMTYAHYHEIKGGKSQKNAPTYLKEEEPSRDLDETQKIGKYECTVCGYVYDPEKGDPDSDIKPGTPFKELPEDWTCPICGAKKDAFKKIE